MSRRNWQLPRRTFLGGAGVAIGLPFLEAMMPTRKASAHAPGDPQRLLAFYVPNGIHMAAWTPDSTGPGFTAKPIMQPLVDAGVLENVTVISGLRNVPAQPEGPGDHAGGTSAFLTATHVTKSETTITNGTSFDQVYADFIGSETPMPSMQLGMEGGSNVGDCDSGYGCAYSRNISWVGNTPLSKLTDPQTAFDLLFSGFDPGASAEQLAQRKAYRLSVLDYALEDATALKARLGKSDKVKVEQYLDAVRNLETRVESESTVPTCTLEAGFPPDAPGDFEGDVRLMIDIMVKAFQCDRTRVISYMLGNAGSGRDYGFIGAPGGHHNISHHGGVQSNFDMLQTIDTFEVAQLAYLLSELKASPEGTGTVLDNTMVFFSSEIEDGNSHAHTNLPIIVGGGGGGTMPVGEHVSFPDTPIANLFIDMLQKLGVDISTFGDDGTGPLGL
jgi:hypothetical protein